MIITQPESSIVHHQTELREGKLVNPYEALFNASKNLSFRNFSSHNWKQYWHYKYCFVLNHGIKSDTGDAPILKSNKPGICHLTLIN